MAYLNFLLIYLALPVLLLMLTQPRPLAGLEERGAVLTTLGAAAGCVFLYSLPLVNYAAYRGIWWYETGQTYASVGYAPMEEYLMVVLSVLFTGLLLLQVLGRHASWPEEVPQPSRARRLFGAVAFAALSVLGVALLLQSSEGRGLYLGLVLTWACPALFGLCLYGGHLLRGPIGRLFLVSTGLSTAYLWLTIWAALAQPVRIVSRAYSTGLRPLGLPVEDALLMLFIASIVNAGILLPLARRTFSSAPHISKPN